MTYEHGLEIARDKLPVGAPEHRDLLVYEHRLRENLQGTRLFGDTETRRADRAEIIDQLNYLLLRVIGQSFIAICEKVARFNNATDTFQSDRIHDQTDARRSAVRELVSAAFDDEELTSLCFDHFPVVYDDFSAGMSKSQKIQRLLAYCVRRDQTDLLLNLVRERNPTQYERYQNRLF